MEYADIWQKETALPNLNFKKLIALMLKDKHFETIKNCENETYALYYCSNTVDIGKTACNYHIIMWNKLTHKVLLLTYEWYKPNETLSMTDKDFQELFNTLPNIFEVINHKKITVQSLRPVLIQKTSTDLNPNHIKYIPVLEIYNIKE